MSIFLTNRLTEAMLEGRAVPPHVRHYVTQLPAILGRLRTVAAQTQPSPQVVQTVKHAQAVNAVQSVKHAQVVNAGAQRTAPSSVHSLPIHRRPLVAVTNCAL